MPTQHPLQIKSRHGYPLAGVLHLPDGDGSFPLIICCHGYKSSKESKRINIIIQTLQDSYACVRFDFSGHGASGGKIEEVTPTLGADDLEDILLFIRGGKEAFLQKIDKKKIILEGSSFGGGVVLLVAARHPEVKALQLFAPTSDYQERWVLCQEAAKKGKNMVTLPFSKFVLEVYCKLVEDGMGYNFYLLARKITCPTIIFHGDKDTIIPLEHSRRLKEVLPNAQLEIVKGADHLFNDDLVLYAELARKGREFLDKCVLRSSGKNG